MLNLVKNARIIMLILSLFGQINLEANNSVLHPLEICSAEIQAQKIIDSSKTQPQWNSKYGEIELQPFNGEWLRDFPFLVEHIKSEQLLHLRGVDGEGKGLHFETNKFIWNLSHQFDPDARQPDSLRGGFQTRIGYYIIPLAKADVFISKNLSAEIRRELEVYSPSGELLGYRFFVHPEAYSHFNSLHHAGITFIQPHDSEFMGTPTSSYRSWVVRRTIKQQMTTAGTIPFIVKFGVGSSPNIGRLLPKNDVDTSMKAQSLLDQIPSGNLKKSATGSDLLIFAENFGVTLKDIDNYPPAEATIDSGMIIREFPQELLQGTCKIFSFSALISVERTRPELFGLCSLMPARKSTGPLPLIYEVIQATIDRGLVANTEEFINRYLIDGYLNAIEELYMLRGVAFAPHGQNLCMVLNADNTPRGFIYRDMEGVSLIREQKYIETFSWFYRYHIFIKLLNVITNADKELMDPPHGAPFQRGHQQPLQERMLYPYIVKNINSSIKVHSETLNKLSRLSLTHCQYHVALKRLDEAFLMKLERYFNLTHSGIIKSDGSIPSSEKGSIAELQMRQSNLNLWKNRKR